MIAHHQPSAVFIRRPLPGWIDWLTSFINSAYFRKIIFYAFTVFYCFIDLLIHWLVDWFNDSMIHWLVSWTRYTTENSNIFYIMQSLFSWPQCIWYGVVVLCVYTVQACTRPDIFFQYSRIMLLYCVCTVQACTRPHVFFQYSRIMWLYCVCTVQTGAGPYVSCQYACIAYSTRPHHRHARRHSTQVIYPLSTL